MPTMYDRAGNPVQVADADVASMYQNGQLTFLQDQVVDVVRDGTSYNIPASQFAQALDAGFRNETTEETTVRREKDRFTTGGQKLLTGLEGGVSGASFGATDFLAGQLSPEYGKDILKRREHNPAIATGTQIAGAVLPAVFTGGTSAAVTGTGLLARTGRALGTAAKVVSAPSRAVTGLAQAGGRLAGRTLGGLESSTLGRIGQRIAVTGVEGGIEGALAGAGMVISEESLAGGDFENIGERALAGAQRGGLLGFGLGGLLGGGIGVASEVARKAPLSKLVDLVGDQAALKALNPSKAKIKQLARYQDLKGVNQRLLDDGVVQALDSVDEMLIKADAKVTEYGKKIGQALDDIEGQAGRMSGEELVVKIQKAIDDRTQDISGGFAASAKHIEQEVSQLPRFIDITTDEISVGDLHRFRRKVDQQINFAGKVQDHQKQGALKELRDIVEGEIEGFMSKAPGGDVLDAYRDAKKGFAANAWARDQLVDQSGGHMSNRMFGLSDTITGAAAGAGALATGNIGLSAVGGMGATVAHKLVREKAWGVMAGLTNSIRKRDKRVTRALNDFFSFAGRARTMAIGEVARRDLKAQKDLDKVLERKKSDRSVIDAYNRFKKRSEDIVQNPQIITDKMGPRVFAAAPQTAAAMTQKIIKGHEYLLSKAPASMKTNSMQGNQDQIDPSPTELAEFAERVQIVKDPDSVLDELNAGTLSLVQVETLRDTRPEIYHELQTRITEEMVVATEPVPYNKRIVLGTLFELPTDPSLAVEDKVLSQAAYVVPPKPPMPRRSASARDIPDMHRSESEELVTGEVT